jgi:hypothetical protein
MDTLQLPNFKNHPECAIGLMTLETAKFLIDRGCLTIEGARFIFPVKAWPLLPKYAPEGQVLGAQQTYAQMTGGPA